MIGLKFTAGRNRPWWAWGFWHDPWLEIHNGLAGNWHYIDLGPVYVGVFWPR